MTKDELKDKIKPLMMEAFNRIIDEHRPGTLQAERPAIIGCMAAAAHFGISLMATTTPDDKPGT